MSESSQVKLANVLRPATNADILPIARVFLDGLDTSLPNRKLASEIYQWERDVEPLDGRLRRRLERELSQYRVVVALVGEEDRVGGYVTWSNPRMEGGSYKAGEIDFLFVDPALHSRGLGSALLSYALSAALSAYQTLAHHEGVIMGVRCFSTNVAGVRAYQRRGFVVKSEYIEDDVNEKTSWMEWSG